MDESDNNVTNQDIYDLIQQVINQNNDLKTEIANLKENLNSKNEIIDKLGEKVVALEETNKLLKERVYITEKKLKRNNIIIFGLQENENVPLLDIIKNFFEEKLNVQLLNADIDDVYRIGRKLANSSQRPIVVRLASNLKKRGIFNNIRLLKDTGISVADDLTEREREERKLLNQHCRIAKSKGYSAKQRGNKLIINGKWYTYEDLRDCTLPEETTAHAGPSQRKSLSAPNTPQPDQAAGFVFENPLSQQLVKGSAGRKGASSRDVTVETRSRSGSKSSQHSEKSTTKVPIKK